ncbi:MAG: hypothetical protein M1830_002324, partial [Pleopsidium flavum]
MESRRQGPPAVYTPTGRDHSTVQDPPNIYKPPQASARIRTDYNTQRAPLKSPYSPSFEPEYNSNTVSSWLPDKEQQQRNGRVTTNPHRKRVSQGNEQQAMSYVPSPDVLPAAPDVPRAPPPISYRDPYANGAPPAPYQGSSRSFSARARALQSEAYSPPTTALSDDFARSGEQQTTRQRRSSASNSSTIGYPQFQPAVPPSYSSSSTYAAIPLQHSEIASPKQNGTATSPFSRSNTRKESEASTATVDPRKNWASDRSPLQKLEGKLNDISKEEKRARVEEAEQLLRKSKAGTGDRRPDRGDAPPPGRAQSRRVSGAARHRSEEAMLTTDQNSGKQILRARVASEGGRTTETDRSTLQARDESEYRHQQYSQKQNTYTKNGADRSTGTQDRLNSQYQQQLRTPEIAGYRPPLANDRERSVKFQDQQNQAKPFGNETRPDDGPPEQRGTLYDRTALTTTDRSSGDSAADIPGRGSSRRFHKEQSRSQKPATGDRSSKVVPQEQRQLYTNRIEPSKMGESAASHGGIPDPVPGHAVRNPRGHVPRYEVPPQTAGAQQARQQVGFGNRDNGDVGIVPDRKHHVSNLLHPGRRDPSMSHETPRTAPGRLDEWRMGGTARLTARDFVIDTDEAATKKAWWEGGQSGSQRENGRVRQDYGKGSPLVGGYEEEHAGPTSFRPPLYLKCGPLLRYTGLKRERVTRTSNRGGSHTTERELWRGSVMIVTVDSDSTYEAAPRLRLFAQPMDLLPAPPQQLDSERGEQFAPEYIDPIAGLPKISRTGKTVYVKPVEHLAEEVDFSRIEDNRGLFEEFPDPAFANNAARDGGLDDAPTSPFPKSRVKDQNSEKMGKFQEVKGIRLHAEKGVTFWRFNLEVELNTTQKCIAYRINRGPAIKFW